MEKNFGLFFYLKQAKSQRAKGRRFIYLKITIDGKSVEVSSKRLWEISKWNSRQGRAIGNSEEVKTLNAELAALETSVYIAKTYLLNRNLQITAVAIKKVMLGETEDNRTVLKVFGEHNKRMKELVGKEYAEGTMERFETSYKHTADFIKYKYNKEDVLIRDLDFEFINDYFHWLKVIKKCGQNTAIKYLGNFKKPILECVKKGWLLKDPFFAFSAKPEKILKVPLTQDELNSLIEKKFSTERLSTIRDIFVFSCYTGLAYIDVKNLKKENLVFRNPNELWIVTARTKTKTAVRLPVLPLAHTIIEKYSQCPAVLKSDVVIPIPTNQKVNEYLKEIATLCNVNKPLTFHLARHTFATTITLGNGVPIETVSKILGHTNLAQTQHYAQITDVKLRNDMLRLQNNLKITSKKGATPNLSN